MDKLKRCVQVDVSCAQDRHSSHIYKSSDLRRNAESVSAGVGKFPSHSHLRGKIPSAAPPKPELGEEARTCWFWPKNSCGFMLSVIWQHFMCINSIYMWNIIHYGIYSYILTEVQCKQYVIYIFIRNYTRIYLYICICIYIYKTHVYTHIWICVQSYAYTIQHNINLYFIWHIYI